jgi:hypothetical protein
LSGRRRLGAVVAGFVVVAGCSAREKPVDIVRTPSSYRIVYRGESGRGSSAVVTTDKVWVRRPWESRLESWTGAPPGKTLLSTQVASFGRRVTGGPDSEPLVLDLVPAVPASDVRMQPSLADAIARKLVERRGVRHIAGRTCQVYRTANVLADTVYARSGSDAVDSCVDVAGLLLEEVVMAGGKPVSRRVAISVEEDAAVADELFATTGTPIKVTDGGGFVRQADPATHPEGESFELATPPTGWTFRGRYTVIPPQPHAEVDPSIGSNQLAGTADVYERGADVFLVDQGATLRGADAFKVDRAHPTVDLGPLLGRGEVLIGPRGNEVRVALKGGRYVRVYGTLAVGELAALARELTPVEGTGLVYL